MKNTKSKISLACITFLIGLMIAIQFQTVKEPQVRDTRDTWELRKALNKETETQTKLLEEIRNYENRVNQYESEIDVSKEHALEQTLEELRKEVGLTEIEGPGIIISIDTLIPSQYFGTNPKTVSPIILRRLINELNMYGALHISIDGERMINTTVIRDINGETKVGNHSLRNYPFEIKVIVDNVQLADKLYKRMQASPLVEDFIIDQFQMKMSLQKNGITIPPYVDQIELKHMEPAENKGD